MILPKSSHHLGGNVINDSPISKTSGKSKVRNLKLKSWYEPCEHMNLLHQIIWQTHNYFMNHWNDKNGTSIGTFALNLWSRRILAALMSRWTIDGLPDCNSFFNSKGSKHPQELEILKLRKAKSEKTHSLRGDMLVLLLNL